MSSEKRKIAEKVKNSVNVLFMRLQTLHEPKAADIERVIESVFDEVLLENGNLDSVHRMLHRIYHPDRLSEQEALYSLLYKMQAINLPENVLVNRKLARAEQNTIQKINTPPFGFIFQEMLRFNIEPLIETLNEKIGWYGYRQKNRLKALNSSAFVVYLIVFIPWTFVHNLVRVLLILINNRNDWLLNLFTQKRYKNLTFEQKKVVYLSARRAEFTEEHLANPNMTDEQFYDFLVAYEQDKLDLNQKKTENKIIKEIKGTTLTFLLRISIILQATKNSLSLQANNRSFLAGIKIFGIIFGGILALSVNVTIQSLLRGLNYFLQIGAVLGTLVTGAAVLAVSGILEGCDFVKNYVNLRKQDESSILVDRNPPNKEPNLITKSLGYDPNKAIKPPSNPVVYTLFFNKDEAPKVKNQREGTSFSPNS